MKLIHFTFRAVTGNLIKTTVREMLTSVSVEKEKARVFPSNLTVLNVKVLIYRFSQG